MAEDRRQTIDEFEDSVNMTRKELENWLRTDGSKSVGQEEGESKGYESGRRIVGLLEKNKSDYTDDDIDHMKKVNSSSSATSAKVHRATPRTPGGATPSSTFKTQRRGRLSLSVGPGREPAEELALT